MAERASVIATRKYGVMDLVDPRPYAVGSIRQVFAAYPHLGSVLPAMGYGAQQTKELQETIAGSTKEEHTSELQSPDHLVCRLPLEKKNPNCRDPKKPSHCQI